MIKKKKSTKKLGTDMEELIKGLSELTSSLSELKMRNMSIQDYVDERKQKRKKNLR